MTASATSLPAQQGEGATLVADGLSVTIDGARLVNDVSFRIEPGEWLGMIGPNGAGKSTVLRAVAGIAEHDGTISLINSSDGSSVRPGPTDIAIVPQNPVLPLGMTVIEYVLLGRTAYGRARFGWLGSESSLDRQIAGRMLAELDLERFATRPITQLSGGEAQRTVLARALAQEPSVLLLDEPTSALDVGHQQSVLELVDDLRRTTGLTVLAAMHDLTLAARFSDRLALLTDGRLDTVDEPAAVLQDDLLSEAYGVKLTVARVDRPKNKNSNDTQPDLVVLPAAPTRRNR